MQRVSKAKTKLLNQLLELYSKATFFFTYEIGWSVGEKEKDAESVNAYARARVMMMEGGGAEKRKQELHVLG